MPAAYHSIDLARFALRPGEGRRLDLAADPGQLELGGERYAVAGDSVEARLDLSRTAAGYAVRMRFTAHVSGPCMRCLEDAEVAVEVDAREVDQPGTEDEELRSPYIEDDELDLELVGPRRPGPGASHPASLPARLQGPVPGLRRLAQRHRSGTAPPRGGP